MKGKKGVVEREVALWIIAIIVLVVLVLIVFFMKSKGLELLEKIFSAIRFR